MLSVAVAVIFVIAALDAWRVRTNLQKAQQQLKAAYHEREPMGEQSKAIQVALEKMLRDLVQLASTDADAQAIVSKYGIQINQPPAATQGASASKQAKTE